MKENLNSLISTLNFGFVGIFNIMLFAGAFVSRTDRVKESVSDTLFFIVLGVLVPLLFCIGVYFLIRSCKAKEKLRVLPIIFIVLSFLSMVYYIVVLPLIIELIEYNLN